MKTSDKILLGILVVVMIGLNSFIITALANGDVTKEDTSTFENDRSITSDQAKMIALKAVPGTVIGFGADEEFGIPLYEVEIFSNGIETEVLIDPETGAIFRIAEEDEDEETEADVPITGSALEKASQVALDYIGEGRVTDSEIGDEEGYYEIEITLNNGNEVDVHLDEDFNVLSVEYD